jgi:hypothetical protein
MKVELILIAIVAMAASLSAYAQGGAEDLSQGAVDQAVVQSGYQQGLCTVAQPKI